MGDELQFEQAEYAADAATQCEACGAELGDHYFSVGGKWACDSCHAKASTALPLGTPASRFFAALGLGVGGALLGFIVYYAVYKATGYEFGLISIGVGVAVGVGVRKGARGVGGIGYQLLAVALTYISIASTYYMLLIDEASKQGELSGAAYVVAIPIAFAVPFLAGAENILGILIIGFGLWEAWKLNRAPAKIEISGPFKFPVAPAPAPDAA